MDPVALYWVAVFLPCFIRCEAVRELKKSTLYDSEKLRLFVVRNVCSSIELERVPSNWNLTTSNFRTITSYKIVGAEARAALGSIDFLNVVFDLKFISSNLSRILTLALGTARFVYIESY
ncbi:hypothetical protein HPP92_019162 [Vanilla planifolia]|uniref:Secreted protein n=1 Tax=Vanilla planifolia TaxID=51239 RepID=A0A835Q5A5_VANPL|nr:hypothetical protein HPP92_019162 [Vanilla planifolia]